MRSTLVYGNLLPSIGFYGGGRTNPYVGSLLDDCNPASKEPMYGLFRPNRLYELGQKEVKQHMEFKANSPNSISWE